MASRASGEVVHSDKLREDGSPLFEKLRPHLDRLETSIGTTASNVGQRFELARQGVMEEQALAAELLGAFGVTDGFDVTSVDVSNTLASMLARIEDIAVQLEDALLHLERVSEVLQRALQVNADLRRTGRKPVSGCADYHREHAG